MYISLEPSVIFTLFWRKKKNSFNLPKIKSLVKMVLIINCLNKKKNHDFWKFVLLTIAWFNCLQICLFSFLHLITKSINFALNALHFYFLLLCLHWVWKWVFTIFFRVYSCRTVAQQENAERRLNISSLHRIASFYIGIHVHVFTFSP